MRLSAVNPHVPVTDCGAGEPHQQRCVDRTISENEDIADTATSSREAQDRAGATQQSPRRLEGQTRSSKKVRLESGLRLAEESGGK